MLGLHIIDVAFGFGLLTQLTKLADFLLMPHQQRWVQTTCETITLKLDGLRPKHWILVFSQGRGKRMSMYTALAVLFSAESYAILLPFSPAIRSDPESGIILSIITGILCLIPMVISYRMYGWAVFEWICGVPRTSVLVLRSGLVMLSSIGFVGLCTAIGFLFPYMNDNLSLFLGVLVGIACFLLLPVYTAFVGLSLCMLVSEVLWLGLRCILSILNGVMWRIVAYNKGALAAITLLLTVALGVLEIVSRSHIH